LRYVSALVEQCEDLETFPLRGMARDDIRPGLRITQFRGRTVIAFAAERDQVVILGLFHVGRDFERALRDDSKPLM
jgi:toxin ParE1/3/4